MLGRLAQQAAQVYPRIEVEGAFSACRDEPVSLSLRDCGGNCVFAQADPPQEARTKPTDEERVRQSLSKTGGTPYRFATLDIDLEAGLMLPVSQINSLRRDALSSFPACGRSRIPTASPASFPLFCRGLPGTILRCCAPAAPSPSSQMGCPAAAMS